MFISEFKKSHDDEVLLWLILKPTHKISFFLTSYHCFIFSTFKGLWLIWMVMVVWTSMSSLSPWNSSNWNSRVTLCPPRFLLVWNNLHCYPHSLALVRLRQKHTMCNEIIVLCSFKLLFYLCIFIIKSYINAINAILGCD